MTKDELLKLVTVLQAELDATNRQVEILSDALAESRREIAALKAVQEPVVFYRCNGCGHAYEQVHPTSCDCMEAGGFDRVEYYTTPPAAQPAPVQPVAWMFQHGETGRMNYLSNDGMNSPSTFVEMNPRYALVCPLYTTPPAAAVQEGRDWSLLEATQESLREHMAEIKRLKAAQPAVPDALNPKDENPAYAAGWNDCRAAMLEILKARGNT